jgi:hypothetical protein
MLSKISIKTVPQLIIIFSIFLILFGYTNITIKTAELSFTLLVVMLTMNQIGSYFIFNYQNRQYQGAQIYTIVISGLITILLLYVLYIKRIYTEEFEIIKDLKEKDIIEDTNIVC